MLYPGIIQKDSTDKASVKAIQKKLNQLGCGPVDVDGDFGPKTAAAVKTFQARFTDQNGSPLKIDGSVGPLTWAALFGSESIDIISEAPNSLLRAVVNIADTQVGVMEQPPGSNNGLEVNMYQDSADVPHGLPWCMAFVYWCFDKACSDLGRSNPLVKTGGVLDHWNRATCKKILADDAVNDPSLIKPGQIFIMSFGSGTGHTGIIEKVEGGFLTTIEGNSNDGGSREGTGVFRRTSRKINSINKGFLHYV